MNLFLNVKTALHVDGSNDRHPNLVAGISAFRGGQILVENPQGEHVTPTPKGCIPAALLDVVGTHVLFDAHKCKHETVDWEGERLVLVAFSVKGSGSLCSADRDCILDQGFALPDVPSCSTNDLPSQPLSTSASCLSEGLPARVNGKNLGDLLFLE